jgi:WD40 repeat protein
LATSSHDGGVAIWDLDAKQCSHRLEGHADTVTFSAFSPDGSKLLTASQDSSCILWDVAGGEIIHQLVVPPDYLDPIHNASINHHGVFTSDGEIAVTVSSGDGAEIHQPALVWNTANGTLMHALGHRGAIWKVLITEDDRQVITASYDGTACVWDINTGEKVRTLAGHSNGIYRMCLFHDGKLLATGSRDGSVRVWLLAAGEMVHELRGDDPISALSAAEQGRLLATGASNGTVRLWDGLEGHLLYETSMLEDVVWDLALREHPLALYARPSRGKVEARLLPPLGQPLLDLAWRKYAPDNEPFTVGQRERFGFTERYL